MRKPSRPPSRIRYEAANPTVSVRVSRDIHERIKRLKRISGKSLGDIVREALAAHFV